MSEQLQLRRGTASQIATFTGAQGELVVDATNNRLVLQDGATAGGFAAAKLSEVPTLSRTPVNDVSYTAVPSDRIVAYTAISAARTVTLPAASAYPTGQALWIVDESGGCSSTNAITVAHAGSDTIDGTAAATLNAAYDSLAIISNGVGKWTVIVDAINQEFALLGVGTAPDPSNTLSVAGSSALFNGTNFNLSINKSASVNTASIIFEDGFSGRAQMGLNGSDNYSFKVSPNGSTWTTALSFDATTGAATLANTRTPIADAAYAVLVTDRLIAFTSITAARMVTLPAASSYPAGQILIVVDESGSCSSSNTITVTRSGTDVIDGANSIALGSPYGYLSLQSNGSSKWTVLNSTGPSASTPGMDGAAAVGTSFNYARADHIHPSDTTRAALTGATFTGALVATAGTAAVAPLKMQTGVNLTTAAAGVLEYDGTAFYSTVAASERGVLPSEQIAVLTTAYTLTSQTAAQKLLNSTTNGALSLTAGAYQFECFFSLTSMSTTSGSFGFALAGTATLTQAWEATAAQVSALGAATTPQTTFNSAANTSLTTAGVNTFGYAIIKGILRVTIAGTVIPQVSLTVAAPAVIGANSYFKVSPLGASTVASVGAWS